MKIYSGLCRTWNRGAAPGPCSPVFYSAVLAFLLILVIGVPEAWSQVVPSAYNQSLTLFVGGEVTGQYLQYGERKQLGATGLLDVDTNHHIGAEVETTWIHPRSVDNLHTLTFQAGPRYRINVRKYEPYVKFLAGVGEFSYPYHFFGTGGFLILSPGGGVDYNLKHRIRLRLVDFEYTYWPEFTYNPGTTTPISSATISSGIRVRIF
jgi:hypothetical protein